MKYSHILLSVLMIAVCTACSNKKQSIIRQNNIIVHDLSEFYRINDRLFLLFDADTLSDLQFMQYDSLTSFIKSAMAKYDTIQPATDDNSLIISMQQFLLEYQKLVFHQYNTVLHILTKPRYLFEANDLHILDSMFSVINHKQDSIDKVFAQQQAQYLQKHEINASEKE